MDEASKSKGVGSKRRGGGKSSRGRKQSNDNKNLQTAKDETTSVASKRKLPATTTSLRVQKKRRGRMSVAHQEENLEGTDYQLENSNDIVVNIKLEDGVQGQVTVKTEPVDATPDTNDCHFENVTNDLVVKEEPFEIRVVEEDPLDIDGDNMDWITVQQAESQGEAFGLDDSISEEGENMVLQEVSIVPQVPVDEVLKDKTKDVPIPVNGERNARLFSQMLPYIFGSLEKLDVLKCRQVCRIWCKAVDEYLENSPVFTPFNLETTPKELERTWDHPAIDSSHSNCYMIFRSIGAFTIFAVHMEHHGRNPFVGRSILLEPKSYDPLTSKKQDFNEFWTAAVNFLKQFGKHVWFLCVSNEFFDDEPDQDYASLFKRLTSQTPNLRSLKIKQRETVTMTIEPYTYNSPELPNLHSLDIPIQINAYIQVFLFLAFNDQLRKLEMDFHRCVWTSIDIWPVNLTELSLRRFCGCNKPESKKIRESFIAPNLLKLTLKAKSDLDAKILFDFLAKFPQLRALNVSIGSSRTEMKSDWETYHFKIEERLDKLGPVILPKLESLKIECASPTATFMFLKSLPALQFLTLSYLNTKYINKRDVVGTELKMLARGKGNIIDGGRGKTIWKLLPNLKTLNIGRLKIQRGKFCKSGNKQGKTQDLFEDVLPFLYKHISKETVLSCRKVCRRWCDGVDQFIQTHPSTLPFNDVSYKTVKCGWNYVPLDNSWTSKFFVTFRNAESFDRFLEQTKNSTRIPFVGRAVRLESTKTDTFPGKSSHINSEKYSELETSDLEMESENGRNVRLQNKEFAANTNKKDDKCRSAMDESKESDYWQKAIEFLKVHGKHVWHLQFCQSSRFFRQNEFQFYKTLQACLAHVPNLRSLEFSHRLNVMETVKTQKEFMKFVADNPLPQLTQLNSLQFQFKKNLLMNILEILIDCRVSAAIEELLFQTYGVTLSKVEINMQAWLKYYGLLPNLKEIVLQQVNCTAVLSNVLLSIKGNFLQKLTLGLKTSVEAKYLFELLEPLPHLRVLNVSLCGVNTIVCSEDLWPPNLPSLESLEYNCNSTYSRFLFLKSLPNLQYLKIPQLAAKSPRDKYGKELLKCAFGDTAQVRQSEIWNLMPLLKVITMKNRKISRCGYIAQEDGEEEEMEGF